MSANAPIAMVPPAVATMIANQTVWLEKVVSGNVYRSAPHRPDELSLIGNTGLGICLPTTEGLDECLAWLRTHSTGNLLIWSAIPNPVMNLALHARGAQESFAPHWMTRTLTDEPEDTPLIPDIAITRATVADRDALLAARNVPYTDTPHLAHLLHLATDPATSGDVHMLLARRLPQRSLNRTPGRIVGIGILHLHGTGSQRNGALFNLGVDPAWRKRGIGNALTREICRIAWLTGAQSVALNATGEGEPVYRRQGFMVDGDGQTWFHGHAARINPPSSVEIANAEALGRGECHRLDPRVAQWRSLPNGDTPLAFAARFGQPETAAWLLKHGAMPDIVPLWTLGLRQEAIAAMSDAHWLNQQRSPAMTTPLHEAVRLNDTDLVDFLLRAGANLDLRDSHWHSRPLDWARALNHPHLAARIERAES